VEDRERRAMTPTEPFEIFIAVATVFAVTMLVVTGKVTGSFRFSERT
jgi:hypothetical protein